MDRGLLDTVTNIWQSLSRYAGIKAVLAIFYTIFAFFFDTAQEAGLLALLILIIFDFITAIANAYHKKIEIQSRKVFITAGKIAIYFGLIASGNLAEHAVPILSSIIDETILAFLTLTELVSIIENVGKLGFAIPKKLLNKLEDLRDSK